MEDTFSMFLAICII